MNEQEYIPGDNDCITMTRQNRNCHPGGEKLILMNQEQARELVEKASQKRPMTKEEALMQLIHVLAPVFICATWILGAMEGLADPVFTGVVTAVCILWAVVNYKWGNANA